MIGTLINFTLTINKSLTTQFDMVLEIFFSIFIVFSEIISKYSFLLKPYWFFVKQNFCILSVTLCNVIIFSLPSGEVRNKENIPLFKNNTSCFPLG